MNSETINRKKRTVFLYVITAILPAVAFCLIYGLDIINPLNTDWLLSGGDLTQHYLGWKAYRAGGWHFPIGMIDTIAYPNRISIIFTDSIPIFAVFFKIISPLLPGSFQYFGIWGLFCFIMQGVLTVRIIKNYSDNSAAIITCGLLSVFTPVMILRMYAHTSLAGQWLILLALEPIFNYRDYQDNNKLLKHVALTALLASSVHIYFVLMTGIIVSGICILSLFKSKRPYKGLMSLAVFLTVAVSTVFLLGGFSSEQNAKTAGLGFYSFNLNGFFNPQGWSCILPDLKNTGDQEGFAYLGAGIILLFLVTALLFIIAEDNWKKLFRYKAEIITLIIVTAISVAVAASPTVTLGDRTVLVLRLPSLITDIWAVFRASERVIWVAVYVIEITAFILVCTLKRRTIAVIICIVILLLQIFDIHNVLLFIHNRFGAGLGYANTEESFYTLKFQHDEVHINESALNEIVDSNGIRHIVFISEPDYDTQFVITDWAMDKGLTLNRFYFARGVLDKAVEESTAEALRNPSEEFMFIVPEDSCLLCRNYDLHYYDVDGLIIGYADKLDDLDEIDAAEMQLKWIFKDDKYLFENSGKDTERGRLLYPQGYSGGPYWTIPRGKYSIMITGESIPDEMDYIIRSADTDNVETHAYNMEKEKDKVTLEVAFDRDVSNLEIIINNLSNEAVLLKEVSVQYNE